MCVNYSTFTMTGGTIKNNTANGGGVSMITSASDVVIENTFEMTGGSISGNNALLGGGVSFTSGTFTMTGGEINDNTAEYGVGGVLVLGTFKISGGEISGNVQTGDMGVGYCGGVCVGHDMFADEDVEISFEISGTPVITGNKATIDEIQVENNVCLFDDNKITVTGELTEGAKIGVYDAGEVITGFTQEGDPADFFIPDDPAYNCIYVSDEETGAVFITTHYTTGEGTVDKVPTCTEPGIESKHCTNCGKHLNPQQKPALGHTLTHHEATAATEEEEGNTEYWSCDRCGKYFEDEAGENEITDKTSVVISKLTPTTPTEPTPTPTPDNNGSDKTPSAPAEETKTYWWLFWLLIPLAIGVGGVTLGIWVYKDNKKNNRL